MWEAEINRKNFENVALFTMYNLVTAINKKTMFVHKRI
jgi:hypothetical protein